MTQHDAPRYTEPRSTLEPLLTITAACDVMGISKPTMYRLLSRREIEATRVGHHLRFEPQAIRDYLNRRREAATA